MPLVNGLNELKITSGTDVVYVNVTKIDSKEGQYVKWLNENGGWSYWLFNCIHKRDNKTKDLDDINNDFDNVWQGYKLPDLEMQYFSYPFYTLRFSFHEAIGQYKCSPLNSYNKNLC